MSGAENISFVPNHDDVELDSASEEEEIEKKEPETDNKEQGDPLADKLVRLMSAAGTEKNGESAWWRASQVRHGLLKIYPALDEWTTHAILRALCNEDIVKEVNIITDVGHETGFVLADDYEDYYEKPEFSVKESILRILRSAVDDEGYYVGWTYNQLIAAVRSESSKVSDEVVEKSIVSLESEGMVVTWETKKNRYVAIDHETMERYWSRLKKIGHEPRNATPPTPTSSQDDENDDVPTTWDGVKAKLRLDKSFFSTDLTGRLLREFRSQPTRLWRDYDIEGLFKGDKETQEFKKDEDGKTSQLFEAIEKLIAAGLIEYIKRDSRPSLHEDRWGLTELGRVGTE